MISIKIEQPESSRSQTFDNHAREPLGDFVPKPRISFAFLSETRAIQFDKGRSFEGFNIEGPLVRWE